MIELRFERDDDGQVFAVERELTTQEIADCLGPLADFKANLCAGVDEMRDRLIDGGYEFLGHVVQSRPSDRENIDFLGQDAARAVAAGAAAGDYDWHPSYPAGFGFIMADNQVVPLDAFQTVAMREAGAAFKGGLTFFARGLKNQINAAADHASASALAAGAAWPV